MSEIKRRVMMYSSLRSGWNIQLGISRYRIASNIESERDAWNLTKAYAKAKKTVAYRVDKSGRIAERRDFS